MAYLPRLPTEQNGSYLRNCAVDNGAIADYALDEVGGILGSSLGRG